MLKPLAIIGAMAVLAAPALSHAATRCRQANRNSETAGTVIGAIAGGLIGNAVSSGRNRGAGTAIGAVGGAVIGNRIAAGSNQPCPDGYEAYEDGGVVNGYADSQYQQPGYDRYQQSGQVVYDEHRYDSQPSYSYSQAPSYSNDRYTAPQQGYSQPGYSYSRPTSSYSQQTYSYDQQQPDRYDRLSDSGLRTEGYDQSQQYWRDQYGRTCHWSQRSSGSGWRQVCR